MDPITRELIALALREDLGPGDVTGALVQDNLQGSAAVVAREALVVAGCEGLIEVYRQVDPAVRVTVTKSDGSRLGAGGTIAEVEGPARSILSGERVALNILQRTCGIASFTRKVVDAVAGTKARIVDTRKTTPGMRALEKAAVRAGGGHNHRFGLFDGVLIKDNHIAAIGGVRAAIEAARVRAHHLLRIECEVDDLAGLDEALAAGAEVILLDNMSLEDMREAVARCAGRALLEASGGVTLDRVAAIAATGVDLISMGALTHSAPAADIGLDWSP